MGGNGVVPRVGCKANIQWPVTGREIQHGVNMAKATTKKPTKADAYKAALEAIAKLGGRQGAIAADALKG